MSMVQSHSSPSVCRRWHTRTIRCAACRRRWSCGRHYKIGRHLPPGDAARTAHLQHACDVCSQLGARYHQRRAQATLDMPRLRTETAATVEA
jgi:hypothetical protein